MGLLQIASLVVVAASLWLIFSASRGRTLSGRLPTSHTDRKNVRPWMTTPPPAMVPLRELNEV